MTGSGLTIDTKSNRGGKSHRSPHGSTPSTSITSSIKKGFQVWHSLKLLSYGCEDDMNYTLTHPTLDFFSSPSS